MSCDTGPSVVPPAFRCTIPVAVPPAVGMNGAAETAASTYDLGVGLSPPAGYATDVVAFDKFSNVFAAVVADPDSVKLVAVPPDAATY